LIEPVFFEYAVDRLERHQFRSQQLGVLPSETHAVEKMSHVVQVFHRPNKSLRVDVSGSAFLVAALPHKS
jgi:hypothetical protein